VYGVEYRHVHICTTKPLQTKIPESRSVYVFVCLSVSPNHSDSPPAPRTFPLRGKRQVQKHAEELPRVLIGRARDAGPPLSVSRRLDCGLPRDRGGLANQRGDGGDGWEDRRIVPLRRRRSVRRESSGRVCNFRSSVLSALSYSETHQGTTQQYSVQHDTTQLYFVIYFIIYYFIITCYDFPSIPFSPLPRSRIRVVE